MDWKKAAESIEGLNSIAKLTFHIHYYIAGVTQVLEGGPLEIKDKYSFKAPPIKSEEDWLDLTQKFCADSEKFIRLIQKMPEEKLSETFFDEKYGNCTSFFYNYSSNALSNFGFIFNHQNNLK